MTDPHSTIDQRISQLKAARTAVRKGVRGTGKSPKQYMKLKRRARTVA